MACLAGSPRWAIHRGHETPDADAVAVGDPSRLTGAGVAEPGIARVHDAASPPIEDPGDCNSGTHGICAFRARYCSLVSAMVLRC
jgi:hypothetical protein